MSRAQLQSAYPKLTELFSNSRSDDNGKLKPTLERLVASFSFPFSSSEEAKECAKSGGGRFLLTADGALLVSSVCFGACALVLSVSILTSRPLLVRKSVVNSEKRVVSIKKPLSDVSSSFPDEKDHQKRVSMMTTTTILLLLLRRRRRRIKRSKRSAFLLSPPRLQQRESLLRVSLSISESDICDDT